MLFFLSFFFSFSLFFNHNNQYCNKVEKTEKKARQGELQSKCVKEKKRKKICAFPFFILVLRNKKEIEKKTNLLFLFDLLMFSIVVIF